MKKTIFTLLLIAAAFSLGACSDKIDESDAKAILSSAQKAEKCVINLYLTDADEVVDTSYLADSAS
ncbi:MAG: peptide ABC transporter substrate-binding protein, partial [Bacillota bacterium]|nr:peptide ABC transporter substrate-binding protein [Bacillota bacterium]